MKWGFIHFVLPVGVWVDTPKPRPLQLFLCPHWDLFLWRSTVRGHEGKGQGSTGKSTSLLCCYRVPVTAIIGLHRTDSHSFVQGTFRLHRVFYFEKLLHTLCCSCVRLPELLNPLCAALMLLANWRSGRKSQRLSWLWVSGGIQGLDLPQHSQAAQHSVTLCTSEHKRCPFTLKSNKKHNLMINLKQF